MLLPHKQSGAGDCLTSMAASPSIFPSVFSIDSFRRMLTWKQKTTLTITGGMGVASDHRMNHMGTKSHGCNYITLQEKKAD